jgi:hypothetical protein
MATARMLARVWQLPNCQFWQASLSALFARAFVLQVKYVINAVTAKVKSRRLGRIGSMDGLATGTGRDVSRGYPLPVPNRLTKTRKFPPTPSIPSTSARLIRTVLNNNNP